MPNLPRGAAQKSLESDFRDCASNCIGLRNQGLLLLWDNPEMHEFLHNGRGPVYSVRPTQFSENDHHSEAARFDDHSPTGKERPLDFFGQSSPISLGYAVCEGQGDVEGGWDAS